MFAKQLISSVVGPVHFGVLDVHLASTFHRLQHSLWPVRQRIRRALPDEPGGALWCPEFCLRKW
jgi:hypothetical protein